MSSSALVTFSLSGNTGTSQSSSSSGPGTDNEFRNIVKFHLYLLQPYNEMVYYLMILITHPIQHNSGTVTIGGAILTQMMLLYKSCFLDNSNFVPVGGDANGMFLWYTTNNTNVGSIALDDTDFMRQALLQLFYGTAANKKIKDELVIVSFKSFTTADMVPIAEQ